jgi:hypothetical protein
MIYLVGLPICVVNLQFEITPPRVKNVVVSNLNWFRVISKVVVIAAGKTHNVVILTDAAPPAPLLAMNPINNGVLEFWSGGNNRYFEWDRPWTFWLHGSVGQFRVEAE